MMPTDQETQRSWAFERVQALRDILNDWMVKDDIPRGSLVLFYDSETGAGSCFSHGLTSEDVYNILYSMALKIQSDAIKQENMQNIKVSD
jgi:hypothetical protein